jgi:hypothetical protein
MLLLIIFHVLQAREGRQCFELVPVLVYRAVVQCSCCDYINVQVKDVHV